MFEFVTLEYIETHIFTDKYSEWQPTDEEIKYKKGEQHVQYRGAKDLNLPLSDEEQLKILRKKIVEIKMEKFDGDNKIMEAKCCINKDSINKFISIGKRHVANITRNVLGKFCVGAGLSVEEANELFILQDHALAPDQKVFDCIVAYCLKEKLDVMEMIEMCREHGVIIDKNFTA